MSIEKALADLTAAVTRNNELHDQLASLISQFNGAMGSPEHVEKEEARAKPAAKKTRGKGKAKAEEKQEELPVDGFGDDDDDGFGSDDDDGFGEEDEEPTNKYTAEQARTVLKALRDAVFEVTKDKEKGMNAARSAYQSLGLVKNINDITDDQADAHV